MDLSSGKTFWDTTFHSFSYPQLEEDVQTDVLIIGSGMSGALCSYFLSETGLSVTLVDKRKVCSGSTRSNTGLLQYCNDKMLNAAIRSFGEAAAFRHYQLCYEALQTLNKKVIPSLVENPDFFLRKSFYFASCEGDLPKLQEECDTLKKYGFPAQYVTAEQMKSFFSFSKAGAIVTDGDAEVNPFKSAQLLLHYAYSKGVKIYECTKINGRQKHRGDTDILYTNTGRSIQAHYIIYAMGYEAQEEMLDSNGVIESSYALATNMVGEINGWYDKMLIWETARPYLYARRTVDGRIVIGGLDEPVTKPEKREAHLKHKRELLLKQLVEWFPELEGKLKAEYYWGAFFGSMHDGLPTIGMYEEYKNSYFLRGYGGNGTVYSVILAQIITDLITKGKHRDAFLYVKERPASLYNQRVDLRLF
ncbi:MAG: NAD(P)/FAD-dependent oxidoreductase [Bacillus sp. (in: firmicutes)]